MAGVHVERVIRSGDGLEDYARLRHGIPTAPGRKKTTTWTEFIRSHRDVLAATDFFTTEVWTATGLVTYYVMFVMHVATRRDHPNICTIYETNDTDDGQL